MEPTATIAIVTNQEQFFCLLDGSGTRNARALVYGVTGHLAAFLATLAPWALLLSWTVQKQETVVPPKTPPIKIVLPPRELLEAKRPPPPASNSLMPPRLQHVEEERKREPVPLDTDFPHFQYDASEAKISFVVDPLNIGLSVLCEKHGLIGFGDKGDTSFVTRLFDACSGQPIASADEYIPMTRYSAFLLTQLSKWHQLKRVQDLQKLSEMDAYMLFTPGYRENLMILVKRKAFDGDAQRKGRRISHIYLEWSKSAEIGVIIRDIEYFPPEGQSAAR